MVGVVFFYGKSAPALLVRLRTWRRGQRFADVPAHVGIIAGTHAEYFEAIVSGVHAVSPVRFHSQALQVAVPDETALVSYLRDQVGDVYDWSAILDDATGRKLPWEILFNRARKRAHDCSGLVADALLVGGVPLPHEALPETPNDLKGALLEIAGACTPTGPQSPRKKAVMWQTISNWLFNRALRISHATTVSLAKKTGLSVDTISKLNDAGAAIAVSQAEAAGRKIVPGA